MAALRYRPYIDGLRALAVLAVVFYHYGIGPVSGGFVGVDVFFVISGFLITTIIHRDIERGSFSFGAFYERRIRRIFPALFAVLAATIVVGATLLLPSDLRDLSDTIVATLLFASNILFWRRSGYFDPSSDYNPLLHTWSLAVEEQFYIFFPIALLVLARLPRRFLIPFVWFVAVTSFLACVALQAWQPSGTFYLAPFRAWELMVGSLLAVGAIPPIRSASVRGSIALLALVVLVGSFAMTPDGVSFPGWLAAFPVLATAMLLWSGGDEGDTLVHRLLSSRALQMIGLISYSLYLWHWPLLVFTLYARGMEPLGNIDKGLLLAASLILAWASYLWVETPFRKRRDLSGSRNRVFSYAITIVAIIGLAGWAVRGGTPLRRNIPPNVLALDDARHPVIPFLQCDGTPPSSERMGCTIGGNGSAPTALLWGDSHALALAEGFNASPGQFATDGLELSVKSACPPLLGVSINYGSGCEEFNEATIDWIVRNRPATVFLVASWTEYSRANAFYELADGTNTGNIAVFPVALRRTIARLRPLIGRIVVVGPTPGAPQDAPFRLAMTKLHGIQSPEPQNRAKFAADSARFWEGLARINSPGLLIFDPAPLFCNAESCAYVRGDTLLYRDAGHLNSAGARIVVDHLIDWLGKQHAGKRPQSPPGNSERP
ncbi:MAG: acyltransferase family protein [Croceibacterium sp.]